MTMSRVLKWASNKKLVILLSFTTLCFFVSTVALSRRSASNVCIPYADKDTSKILSYAISKEKENITQIIDYRLSRDVMPLNYTLRLWPNLLEKTFRGNVKIRIKILKPVNVIEFHRKKLKPIAISLKKDDKNIIINTKKYMAEKEVSQLQFGKKLDEGTYQLSIEYTGRLDEGIVGLYASTMKNGKYVVIKHRKLHS